MSYSRTTDNSWGFLMCLWVSLYLENLRKFGIFRLVLNGWKWLIDLWYTVIMWFLSPHWLNVETSDNSLFWLRFIYILGDVWNKQKLAWMKESLNSLFQGFLCEMVTCSFENKTLLWEHVRCGNTHCLQSNATNPLPSVLQFMSTLQQQDT